MSSPPPTTPAPLHPLQSCVNFDNESYVKFDHDVEYAEYDTYVCMRIFADTRRGGHRLRAEIASSNPTRAEDIQPHST